MAQEDEEMEEEEVMSDDNMVVEESLDPWFSMEMTRSKKSRSKKTMAFQLDHKTHR